MGSLRVGHDWATLLSLFTFTHWRRKWQPTPAFLPGESQGQRSLVGFRLWDRTESDTTEWLHFHFSLSRIGDGNGGPLQCSCLENPRDGGAWWASVYGIAQSRTRLKRLSSSSSSILLKFPSIRIFLVIIFLLTSSLILLLSEKIFLNCLNPFKFIKTCLGALFVLV